MLSVFLIMYLLGMLAVHPLITLALWDDAIYKRYPPERKPQIRLVLTIAWPFMAIYFLYLDTINNVRN